METAFWMPPWNRRIRPSAAIFRCTEETREATLQKLQHMARTAYGAAPAFTVQLIVVSGILQWTYEAQVYVGEHEKRSAAKSHYSV